jgi:hypothetical protein
MIVAALLALALANPGAVIFWEHFEGPFFRLDFETVEASVVWVSDGEVVAPMGGRDMSGVRPGQTYKVLHVAGVLISDGVTTRDFLLSDAFGHSGATDTPADIPYRGPLQRDSDWLSWTAYTRREGEGMGRRASFIDIGGVVNHIVYSFSASSYVNPATKEGTLDDLRLYDFRRQPAVLYAIEPLAVGQTFTIDDLANGEIVNRGTIQSASFTTGNNDRLVISYMEQTEDGLSVPTTPLLLNGLSRGVVVEDGATISISRADQAALRSTGDQTFQAIFARLGNDQTPFPASTYLPISGPIFQIQRRPSASRIDAMLKNSAATFQTVGTSPTCPASTIRSMTVAYDSATTTATLYVDGVASGSTVITGGIDAAAASAATVFSNNVSTGTGEYYHMAFRHWSRELSATEVAERALYAIQPNTESGLTAALEFSEALGTVVADATGNADGILTNFADADGAWAPSATGEPSAARTRLPAVIGRPFMARWAWLDAAFLYGTPGYEKSTGRSARFVALDYARINAPISQSSTSDFVSTGNLIRVDPGFNQEPAIGQEITFSAGPNAGAHVVAQILSDPASGSFPSGGTKGNYRVDGPLTGDLGRAGNWTGTGDYQARSRPRRSLAQHQRGCGSAPERSDDEYRPWNGNRRRGGRCAAVRGIPH